MHLPNVITMGIGMKERNAILEMILLLMELLTIFVQIVFWMMVGFASQEDLVLPLNAETGSEQEKKSVIMLMMSKITVIWIPVL